MNKTYILEMTPETAFIVSQACELYARAMFGQFDYLIDAVADGIPWHDLPPQNDLAFHEEFEKWLARRRAASEKAAQARADLFPELPRNGNYGVGKYRDADIAWQAHEVLRYTRAWHDHPEGGITVDFDKPMCWTDEPMPKCQVLEKQGSKEWIYCEDDSGQDGYRCSKCGFFEPWYYNYASHDFIKKYQFCPSCGATMKKEINNDD